MKFKIECVNADTITKGSRMFKQIMLELCIRESNNCVGSGLGGNNFQAYALMDMSHTLLEDTTTKLSVQGKEMQWNLNWLATAKAAEVRQELNQVFDSMPEHHKLKACAMLALMRAGNLRQTFQEHKDQFPKLKTFIDKGYYSDLLSDKLSIADKLIVACILCQELAAELDANNEANVDKVGGALSDMPDIVILLSVRLFIQIGRLIKFNLDERSTWAPWLMNINRSVDK